MRLEMHEMQLAMAKVQKGPEPLVTPTSPSGHTPEYPSLGPSTSFPIAQYYQGETSYNPQAPPPKQNPLTPIVPIFGTPPPATLQRSSSKPLVQAHANQYYPPEPTFKAPEPYTYTPHLQLPAETERPTKNPEQDEVLRKMKSLEQYFRSMHGLGSQVSVAYKDLCPFPDVQLPTGFKMPKFDLYEGHGDPMAHLRGFCSKMRGAGGKDELLIAYFGQSLSGSALEWYTRQDPSRWYTWDDLAQAFAGHFQYNLEIVPDRLTLLKLEKKLGESFREFGFRWREQAARVDPPMREGEMVDYFLQTLEPTYFGHLVTSVGKSFNEVVKMGGMIEEGLRSNKILSYSAIKATTQAIQSGTGGALEVVTVEAGTGSKFKGPSPHYQPRPHHPNYSHTPYNLPQPYYPPSKPLFSAHHAQTCPRAPYNPPQYYPPNNVRSHVQPSGHPLWREPAPHNSFLPSQHFRAPNDPRKRGQGGEQRQRNSFTPIGESYTNLFEKLKLSGLIEPLLGYTSDPYAKVFDPAVRCMYHSNVQGHSIEDCRSLKKEIERMIQEGVIVINDNDRELANPLENLLTDVDDTEVGDGLGNVDIELNG
ncbi:uncharacterized protein LOC142164757 [Nicotiana tabacum]|uniref:Uncharacterized protein LOC142164757 n=1 Tax=Nicotiana tabacum TaxID=4097 RepID=A0AC58S347_TOBAC